MQHTTSKPDKTSSSIVTLNIGGQIFQTTKQTLTQASPTSLLSSLTLQTNPTIFIDRDPHLFSVLLSLLRTNTLPSKPKLPNLHALILESQFYGIESLLLNSLSNSLNFNPLDLTNSHSLPLNGRDPPSALSSTENSVHVAHGSKITSFDASFRKVTVLTGFNAVDSLCAVSQRVAAVGANDFTGLRVLDLESGVVRESLEWENLTKSGSVVQAIGKSDRMLFASFESSRRNSNSILVYDLESFRPVCEVGHFEIYGAEIDSAIPATKLSWVSSRNVLMAAGSHSGLSGVRGSVRFWDLRSGDVVWEFKETVDCFADVTVSDTLSGVFKVGVNSGEVYFADFRKWGAGGDSWVCLGDKRKAVNVKKEGVGCKIESHGNQVFCTKGGCIELWSEVVMGSSKKSEDVRDEGKVFRSNLLGRKKDMEGSRVTNLAFGGNKMFVTRKDQQFVEAWESSAKVY